jgi:hypothetical protein
MHGIHNSIVQKETDSNWTTIITWQDLLHGTLQLNIPQERNTIGVPAYQDPKELTIKEIMKMPATADRPSWRLANNGKPERNRKDLTVTKNRMAA